MSNELKPIVYEDIGDYMAVSDADHSQLIVAVTNDPPDGMWSAASLKREEVEKLHRVLTEALGLPDLAQMQRRCEGMEAELRSLHGFISRRSADGLTPQECVSAVQHIGATLEPKS